MEDASRKSRTPDKRDKQANNRFNQTNPRATPSKASTFDNNLTTSVTGMAPQTMNSKGGFKFNTPAKMADAPLEKVLVKDLASMCASKAVLYRALAVKGKCISTFTFAGQIFLPDERCCNIQFLRQVLSGTKDYFHCYEMPTVVVPRHELLSVERVLNIIKNNDSILKFLPDFDDETAKRMPRDFLFAMVNKLDNDFFKRALSQLDKRIKEKAEEKEAATMEVRPELLNLIKNFGMPNPNARPSSSKQRSLQALLGSEKTRKRKRNEREESKDLDLKFQPKRIKY